MNSGDGRCFYQKVRDLSLNSINIFLHINDKNILKNCLRGFQLINQFDQKTKFNNSKKKINIYKKKSTKVKINHKSISIKITNDNILKKDYDLLIIENYDEPFLINNIKKINCNILIKNKHNIKIPNFKNWKLNKTEVYYHLEYIIPNLENYTLSNYSSLYNYFYILTNKLSSYDIEYYLGGYDCLTGYLANCHSCFIDKIELLCNYNDKDIVEKLIDKNKIKLNYYSKKTNYVELYQPKIKINYDDFKPKNINFGPKNNSAIIFSNPHQYLMELFSKKYTKELKLPFLRETIKNPLVLYRDYHDYYTHWRSGIWEKNLIFAGYEFINICKKNNIKCWLDGGCLLGAVRNSNVPPGDDDIDIGIFKKDLQKLYNLNILENGIYRKNINGIFYDVEILDYYSFNDKYKCDRFVDSINIKDRASKTAVPKKYFDTLNQIKLGQYTFPCPYNPKEYVELPQKYGFNCVDSDPNNAQKSYNTDYKREFGYAGIRY